MKNIILILLAILHFNIVESQTVVAERAADLIDQNYTIEGDAFLQELDNGVLRLSLSDDYSTPTGPDVRILLANSLSLTGAVEIVNLSDINQFSGAYSIDLPSSIGIEDYNMILFFCVQFNQLWASGTFGEVTIPGGDFECNPTTVLATNGMDTMNICPTDAEPDVISFSNSLSVAPGDHYAYLITDENEILEQVVLTSSYDFEGSSLETQRVYGIHYDGDLNEVIGANRMQTTASGCHTHSSVDTFLTIHKMACEIPYECNESATATTDWVGVVEICPTDGASDWVALKNNLFIAPGEHYAYLLTDSNEVLQEVILDSMYNFEGSGLEKQRIYGVNYDGDLNPMIGRPREETEASGCFIHSSFNLFLTINKTAYPAVYECNASATATTNWIGMVEICPTDGDNDWVDLKNNLFIAPGTHYAYLLTDTNEILQEFILDSVYNFEGSGLETQRVYGINYDGDLNAQIGMHRNETSASACFTHSSADLFLTINKLSCESFVCLESLTATHNWVTNVDVCATDGIADEIFIQNNIETPPGANYVFLLTDTNEILKEIITDSIYNFEGSGTEDQRIYGLSFSGELIPAIGQLRTNTTATECHIHSGSAAFITIKKTTACATSTFNQALSDQVVVYPNPVSEMINVKYPAEFSPTKITLSSLIGQQVIQQDVAVQTEMQINVNRLHDGIYLLRIENDEQFVTRKVIVSRQ